MASEKKTWSARITPETRERLDLLKVQTGLEPESFLNSLLDSYEIQESEKAELIPSALAGPRREVAVIAKAMQKALDSTVAAIHLAEEEAAQARGEAQDQVGEYLTKAEAAELVVVKLQEQLALNSQALADVRNCNEELEEALFTAKQQIETVSELKNVWREKENELNSRIVVLDAEVKETRELKIKLNETLPVAERAENLEIEVSKLQQRVEKSLQVFEEMNEKLVDTEKKLAVTNARLKSEENLRQKAERELLQQQQDFQKEKERLLHDKDEATSERKSLYEKFETVSANLAETEKKLIKIQSINSITKSKTSKQKQDG